MDMELTLKYYEKAINNGANVSPVLTSKYTQHMSRLILLKYSQVILLGKMSGNIEEDEELKKLPIGFDYHGLAKGRWIKSPLIKSINSSTWLSGVRGRKTDVWKGESITLGDKGKSDRSTLERALDSHKDTLESCSIQRNDVTAGEYEALMKLPIAVYYKPMFKELGFLAENFV